MTTHDNDKAHPAVERGNDLAEQWGRELIAEMTSRRDKARSAADACKEGGWYRGQIEKQVALYDAMLAALTASEAKVQLTDDQIVNAFATHQEGFIFGTPKYEMVDTQIISCVRALLASAPSSPPEAQQPAQQDGWEELEPVDGDLLPPIGTKVLIHLASQDAWVEHSVAGYYVWGAHPHQVKGDPKEANAHRVFVRVRDADGYLNARLLSDVQPIAALSAQSAA